MSSALDALAALVRPRASHGRARTLLTMADQAVSSGSNVAVALAVGKVLGNSEFGRYGLLVLLWLFVVGVHRALVAEPLLIEGAAGESRRRVAAGLGAEVIVGLVASAACGAVGLALLALGQPGWAFPVLAMAACLTPLVVQDYWRATAFRRGEPLTALVTDVAFVVVQVLVFVAVLAAGAMSTTTAVLAWGAGAAAGAVVGAVAYGVVPMVGEGAVLLRELHAEGRWLLADFGTGFAADQLAGLAVVFALTEEQYGDYRAAWTLVGPVMVLYLAVGNLSLPECARRLAAGGTPELRRYADRVSAVVTGLVLAYLAVLAVAGSTVVPLLFSSSDGFASVTGPALVLGLGFVPSALVYGRVHALKVTGTIRRLWVPRIVLGTVSVALTLALTARWAVDGAAWAWPVAGVAYLATVLVVAAQVLRTPTAAAAPPGPGIPAPAPAVPSPGTVTPPSATARSGPVPTPTSTSRELS